MSYLTVFVHLIPNVSRLAISCVMEFDSHGKQIDYEIFESVIKI